METSVILIIVFIVLMIAVLFYILKRMVNKMDQESKSYFLNNLQDYDKLIDEKESKLETIKESLESLKEQESKNQSEGKEDHSKMDPSALQAVISPDLQDGNILKTMREIQDKFQLQHDATIKQFVKNHPEDKNKTKEYKLCQNVLNLLTFDFAYELETTMEKERWNKVLVKLNDETKQYLKKQKCFEKPFNEARIWIEDRAKETDPNIYILTGEKDKNYNDIDSRIQMKYDESIYLGLMICYQNKLYDYSLR